jgi:hypothetical protein
VSILEAIFSLLPKIIQAIHFAEIIFPNAGSGLQKLDTVATVVGKVAAATPALAAQASALVEGVKPVVTTIVGALNSLGVLKGAATLSTEVAAPEMSMEEFFKSINRPSPA